VAEKPEPTMSTGVPPVVGPLSGDALVNVGAGYGGAIMLPKCDGDGVHVTAFPKCAGEGDQSTSLPKCAGSGVGHVTSFPKSCGSVIGVPLRKDCPP
jgi:hypothetical protein